MAFRRSNAGPHHSPGSHGPGWDYSMADLFMNSETSQHSAEAQAATLLEEQRRREQEQETRERGPPPASSMVLKNMPYVKIAEHDLAEETNRSCSICIIDHELGDFATKLPCAHIFHRDCVLEWLELHCTCPVCRFELETDDRAYEAERRVRMRDRKPRYRRRELENLSISQIRGLARGQNVDIRGCLEKEDVVRQIISSGTVEVIEVEQPEYALSALLVMSARQLRNIMLQTGIDVDGCLEKNDLIDRLKHSRLITVTDEIPLQPTPSEDDRPRSDPGVIDEPGDIEGWQRPSPPPTSPVSSSPAPLELMSVKDLRGIMSRLHIPTAGCIEKGDMVDRIVQSGSYR